MGKFLILALSLLSLSSASFAGEIVVFHAGSLSVPFKKMKTVFEKEHPGTEVRLEPSGSVKAIRKVTDLHKPCDVVASADYSLIPEMMFPKYADHVKVFATNELVICYTPKSKFADRINGNNWFEILKKKEVRWGFSNPNLDPCGYRALMMLSLASDYYKKPVFEELLSKTGIKRTELNGKEVISVPENLRPKGNLTIRPKAVALLGLLESGAIDYAVEYKSVALQHGLKFVELPKEINLSSLKFKGNYAKVRVRLGNGKTVTGKPIAYGIAVVKGAPHPKEAKMWEDFVTSKEGAQILKECYQNPVYPPKVIRAGE